MTIIPIVIGAFVTVKIVLLKELKSLVLEGRVGTIQTTALFRTTRILRKKSWRLEEICFHSNSSEKPSAKTNVKNSQEVNDNPEDSGDRLFVPRKEGGRGITSIKDIKTRRRH